MKGKLMNKYGHVTVTKRLTPKLKKRHDLALRLGSIMPDILLHTYIKGHTWDASYDKVSRRLRRLERHGRMNCLSFLSLGYALHYIEDYFTFPHNSWYPEPMSEHVLYEIKFMNYIREAKNDINKPMISNSGRGVSADRMLDYLITNHKQYAANEQGFDNDYSYITSVGYAFIANYVKLFMINSGKDIVIDMNESVMNPSF